MIQSSIVPLSWVGRARRNIEMINREFSRLNHTRLNDKTRLQGYSIMDLLLNLMLKNYHFIQLMERALQLLEGRSAKTYKMGWRGSILLRLMPGLPIKKGSVGLSGNIKNADLFSELNNQFRKISGLILLCEESDMNKRIIPYGKGGILKISAGDLIEYILVVQEKHLMFARRILMLLEL